MYEYVYSTYSIDNMYKKYVCTYSTKCAVLGCKAVLRVVH